MKFAVIESGGKQYKVAAGQKLKVEKLDTRESDNFTFEKVLLVAEDSRTDAEVNADQRGKSQRESASSPRESAEVRIGMPYLMGAKVEGKVLRQGRADKVIVFKYHSKTRYRKKKGHRQPFTEVQITKIS